jgi:hypothetical protein
VVTCRFVMYCIVCIALMRREVLALGVDINAAICYA